jgi:tRNA(fMet)-specific endonuclease VapC
VLGRVRVLPLDPTAAVRAGDILARLDEQGKPIGLEDVLIGATALVNGLAVVTRNLTHFERIEGLRVESWFNS